MKLKRLSISKFLKSNWVITLTSTMIGVIIGLYLTNYNESQKLEDDQEIAFDMVKQELKKNDNALKAYDSISRIMFKKASYVFSRMNEDYEIYISKDSVSKFKEKSKDIVTDITVEAVPNDKNKVKVKGEMTLNVDSKLVILDLNNIIWESYKQTNFLNLTDFECITALEELYQLQDSYNDDNRKWVNAFINGSLFEGYDEMVEFMRLWEKLLTMNDILLNMYTINSEEVSNCY
ncbi:hypothetical protein [uncultured Psychroserpens sp.]|uniref:hypothetical protein n=1 Tax=uncultured Psychroserpens sp. TaxID=255436 RepID=UPI00260A568F|nr:hypothetical protein [uncultured Psychroserpens sp.]